MSDAARLSAAAATRAVREDPRLSFAVADT